MAAAVTSLHPRHRAAVLRELQQIRPLDADGRPAADGKIVFISVGMSNTTMEFDLQEECRRRPAQVAIGGHRRHGARCSGRIGLGQ